MELGALGLVVALGLHRGLRARLPGLGVKWPNDLVVQGRKLGGILCESRWQGQRVEVVVGVGINVTTRSWPEDLAGIAVSIGELAAGPWHTDQILVELLPDLESVLDEFIVGGFAPLQAEYERVCVSLGRPATVSDGTGNKVRWACADGIDATGALWVRDESGRRERVCAGELLLLR